MLSKCLNSHCSATFQYLGEGRLFRIDYTEAGKKRAMAGMQVVPSQRSKAKAMEHFWLCERCASKLTIEVTDASEVRLVPYEIPPLEKSKLAATAS